MLWVLRQANATLSNSTVTDRRLYKREVEEEEEGKFHFLGTWKEGT